MTIAVCYDLTNSIDLDVFSLRTAQKTSVRIGSRQSFYGGVVRHVIRSQYINVTLGDMRMNFCIAMLDLPYEVGRVSGGSFAFLSVIYLRPLGHYAGITEKFMVSGWHGLNRHQLNHRMNAMQVKESNVFTCSQQYYNVEKYVAQQQPDSVGCFCPIECPWICSTDQSPGAVDMGAGFYKKNTNILIGLAQTTVARKTRRVNAIMSYTDRLALNSWMYSLADDEYEDYPEFDTWRGMF